MAFYSRGGNYLPYLQRPRDDWDLPMSRPSGLRRSLSGRRDNGPLLDRDYGDFRSCRRIDPGPLIYPRPPSPGFNRKHMMELEDQLKLYKDELARREKLIEEMKGSNSQSHLTPAHGRSQGCSICNHGNIPSMTKSDIESLEIKVNTLQSQVQEMEAQLQLRDKKIQELKLSCQIAKEKERYGEDSSSDSSSSDAASSHADLAASIMQREIRDVHEDNAKVELERSAKTKELAKENATLKHELSLAKVKLEKAEADQKHSFEKLNQMTLDLERVRHQAVDHHSDADNIRVERDSFLNKQKQLENELTVMHGRLEASNHERVLARNELEQHMTHCGGLNRERQLHESVARSTEAQLTSLRESLARMLSDDHVRVDPSEEGIRERMAELMLAVKEKTLDVERLERKSQELASRLDAHFQVPNAVMRRQGSPDMRRQGSPNMRRQGSPDIGDLEARLRRAEQELMARDEIREGGQSDKEKFWKYLKRLCVALEMEPVAVSFGLDEAVMTILARVEEIMKKDVVTLSKMKSQNQHLQQKLSRMTDQLESKESHLELLRRKVASLEQQFGAKSHLEHDKDNEFSRNRKMQKLIEKYRHELNECHAEIRELKSRLLYTSDAKVRTLGKDHELMELEMEVGQLEEERLRQASKIAGLERVVHSASEEIMEKKEFTNNTIHALSLEIRTTKEMLDEVINRESKLLELRLIIARMLGLDVTTLTVPDYEIISRLEKLILANQANGTTAVVLDNAIADLNGGFQAGYHHASRSLNPAPRQRSRARSLSPRRRVDRKCY